MKATMEQSRNFLGTEKIGKLIFKFAIPSIVILLVSALYNIVDQIFIGQGVGILGNAATNVAFPLTTISTSIALLLGIGGASNYNLNLGAGRKEKAAYIAGNSFSSMLIGGAILAGIVIIFLKPLILVFGASGEVLSLALTYTSITSFGIPFFIFSTGASHLIRADGSPKYSMLCVLFGAVLNTILDPLFIFVFDMGIAGAAWATVIGQVASSALAFRYLLNFKSVKLSKENFIPRIRYIKSIAALGVSACFNQLAMTLVQITMNNTLTYYGALSKYGSEIPLACVGVISKVNIVFMAFIMGVGHGCQPIASFNYGAKNYSRVKKTYIFSVIIASIIATIGFIVFQVFPKQIISIFGGGSKEYFEFAIEYFRIYMIMTFINGVQPVTSTLFTAIGKAKKGIILSSTRQILFLIPLLLIFPLFFGIDGIMYAGPISDIIAATLAATLMYFEIRRMNKEIKLKANV